MRKVVLLLGLLTACWSVHAASMTNVPAGSSQKWNPLWLRHAKSIAWEPSSGDTQISLWPGVPPSLQSAPGAESDVLMTHRLIAGRPWIGVINVTRPTMTIYAPKARRTGAAVLVFPGGGFQMLAIDLEGTEACRWLTSIRVTCVLVKYRVPSAPYRWQCNCYLRNGLAESTPALEDAERAIKLVRLNAARWHVDPHKIGVLGFSAGGFLVAELSTLYNRRIYKPVDAADHERSRPDFALMIYPGHLERHDLLNPLLRISKETPPTFLVQAEDDGEDGVEQSLVYYQALASAHVPAELHIYARGGHAFGLRATNLLITHWVKQADTWLRGIGIIGK